MSALVSLQGTYCFPWLPIGVLEREAYYKGILLGERGGGGVLRIIFS